MVGTWLDDQCIVPVAVAEYAAVEIAHSQRLHEWHADIRIFPDAAQRRYALSSIAEQRCERFVVSLIEYPHDVLGKTAHRRDIRSELAQRVDEVLDRKSTRLNSSH